MVGYFWRTTLGRSADGSHGPPAPLSGVVCEHLADHPRPIAEAPLNSPRDPAHRPPPGQDRLHTLPTWKDRRQPVQTGDDKRYQTSEAAGDRQCRTLTSTVRDVRSGTRPVPSAGLPTWVWHRLA